MLCLRQGPLELQWLPELGASCAALRHHAGGGAPVDILRPLPEGSTDPFQSGFFALLPYANRLFGQVLLADGPPQAPIALNRTGQPHPVHGVGWQRPWLLGDASASWLHLVHTHSADAHWPFDFGATMDLRLSERALRIELSLRNASGQAMPAGTGFHPWLIAEPDAQLRFDARHVWIKDGEGLPLRRIPPAQDARFDAGPWRPVHGLELDHCFAGWRGVAELRRPQAGLNLRLCASADQGHLQVFRPPGQGWVCVEPVSHAAGAFSLADLQGEEHGARLLAPGATMHSWMEIAVEPATGR